MRIGIDFDNTLADYDQVFVAAARERGLIDGNFIGSKREIRDHIRLLPNGEIAWQRLQGYVYGIGIAAAQIFEGAGAFLAECRARALDVYIISHKTRFGHEDTSGVNLRASAIGWMARQGFFASDGFGILIDHVFFESSRAAKLARLREVGCTHFIDDLEEVFSDPGFPGEVRQILFAANSNLVTVTLCRSWQDIAGAVLNGAQ
jgi:hypothetical protein